MLNEIDKKLVEALKIQNGRERQVVMGLLRLLSRIDERKTYAKMGYRSLFDFCVQHCGYAEGTAARRITACRLLAKFPMIESMLQSGRLHLTALAKVSRFLTQENHEQVLHTVAGKSAEFVDSYRLALGGEPKKVKDKIEPIRSFSLQGEGAVRRPSAAAAQKKETSSSSETVAVEELALKSSPTKNDDQESITAYAIRFAASQEFMARLERAKELLSHKFPESKLEDILGTALDALLAAKMPKKARQQEKKPVKRSSRKQDKPATEAAETKENKSEVRHSRYIPVAVKREVWQRDNGACSYVSPCGRACGSRWQVQVDHIKPFAWGGSSRDISNLRLLCGIHNRLEARKYFGAWCDKPRSQVS